MQTDISKHYLQINKEAWNKRVKVHMESAFYDLDGFMKGRSSLNETEIALLGDLKGKTLLHLQCHFGQDTLSLARMGASVVGIDLSDTAIARAQELNETLGLDARFVQSDVYGLPNNLEGTFDIVFTSYGSVVWLPDLEKWAGVVERYLKPGGKLVMVEFHPLLAMYDNDRSQIIYPYFNKGPIFEEVQGTYAEPDADIAFQELSWNHSLGEVIGSLLNKDLRLSHFQEYDFSHYDCFPGMVAQGDRCFRFERLGSDMPLMYALVAQKSKGDIEKGR